jgi:hypothetical protein
MSNSMMSLLLPICLALGACDEGETTSKQPSVLQNQMKADAELMLDIGRAGTELERRLSESVRARWNSDHPRSGDRPIYVASALDEHSVDSVLRRGDIDRIWLVG